MSERRRRRPDARVVGWLDRSDAEALFVSALTLGEIARGCAALSRRDVAAGQALELWLDEIRHQYGDRVLPVDAGIAEAWGRLSADRPRAIVDTLLAATALVHGMTLVTRNLRDVTDTGVRLLNPWEAE